MTPDAGSEVVPTPPLTRPLPPGGEPPTIVWRFPAERDVLTSAAVGGGWGTAHWVLNIGVPASYRRTDLEVHASEVAAEIGLEGPGSTLFTAADTRLIESVTSDRAIRVDATVGVSRPTWAADTRADVEHPPVPGTINLVIQMPVPLTPAAGVNAIMTATEAKTQALVECAVAGTGTASDAIVLVWPRSLPRHRGPGDDPVAFTGVRSSWGLELAQAVHAAVRSGLPPA